MSDPQINKRLYRPQDMSVVEQAVYDDLSNMTDSERAQAYYNSPTVRQCVNKWRQEE
jgi:hypothetical protein